MSATNLKLATIAYLGLGKSEAQKLSWVDVSKAMIFFEENASRATFAIVLDGLCNEDEKYVKAEPENRAIYSADKLLKIAQLFKGRVRNLGNVNGHIASQNSKTKGTEYHKINKNGDGKQAFLSIEIDPANAKTLDAWKDISSKIKSGFKKDGGSISPDLLLGVVWDEDGGSLKVVCPEALEIWCLEHVKKPKKSDPDLTKRIKGYLQQMISSLLNSLNPSDVELDSPSAEEADNQGDGDNSTDDSFPHFRILHGPPGTGKTTLAKEFCEDKGWTPYIIQVHPSYSYEEFIEGLKPITFSNGELRYDIVEGPVKILAHKMNRTPVNILCALSKEGDRLAIRLPLGFSERYGLKKVHMFSNGKSSESYFEISSDTIAINSGDIQMSCPHLDEVFQRLGDPTKDKIIFEKLSFVSVGGTNRQFCLILDELNRGNISQILGELLYSISETESENPKAVKLQYSQQDFVWPKGLHIIGTMNTTDLSTDRMDQAVKRRFTFEYVEPMHGIFNHGEDWFKFLGKFNAKVTETIDKFEKVKNLDEIALRLGKTKISFSQILFQLNTKLGELGKKYGLINVKDKLIGHSFFIKMCRRVCVHTEGPALWEIVFYGEFKETLLGELLPALQSVFNYDDDSLNRFLTEWLGKEFKLSPGTEKWADEVMEKLLWDVGAKFQTIKLDEYRQRQWKKSA